MIKLKSDNLGEVKLPPFEYKELKGVRLLQALSNWAFKHWKVREIWKWTTGKDIRIGVLDTGRPIHKDIDVYKWVDFTGDGPDDKQGHSSWVCGNIKGKRGFLGLTPGCRLYTAKVLDNNGMGDWLWMKKGLEWALENECQIVNVSAGGEYRGNEIQPILKEMAKRGVLIVCAAGNENEQLIFPASSEHTIAVGAVNEEWQKAVFSSYGKRLVVMAPGVKLLGCWLNDGYVEASGTSMSAPGVAGVFGLEMELRKMDLKGAVVKLAVTSIDMGEEGWDHRTGWGIIDPWAFLGFELPEKKKNIWTWIISFLFFLWVYSRGKVNNGKT